jgi:putative tryptophan/tyrosine transport system substrate-binding protein
VTYVSRRLFVQGAGGLCLGLLAGCARPFEAASSNRVYRIGVLFGARTAASPEAEAFRQGLQEHGWREGEDVTLEYRTAEGKPERLPGLAAELVNLPVDLLMTGGADATRAAQQATSAIPIVIGATPDAVAEGLVGSLARPGGNVTGISMMRSQLAGKLLQLLHEATPGVTRVAVLWSPGGPDKIAAFKAVEAAARVLNVELVSTEVNDVDGLEGACDFAIQQNAGAMVVLSNLNTLSQPVRVIQLASERRLPSIYDQIAYRDAGGLMLYIPSTTDGYRRSAAHVDKILKGAKPADLPVEQPLRFDFVINLKTAQALGLTIPQHVLLQATEIIQ